MNLMAPVHSISRPAARPGTIALGEAARRLGLSDRAARRAAAAGEIPAIRINRRWRVLLDAFEAMLGGREGGEG